jgi:predicted alpha/beta-hydrolase family hydrolase
MRSFGSCNELGSSLRWNDDVVVQPRQSFSATLCKYLFLLVFLYSANALCQADYTREKRWADEITPAILVGDPVYLTLKSGHKFLAIHATNPKARAGVIVVHGMGVHPDWSLINALRSQLSEQGYATLSLQMPVLAADAKGEQYPALFPEAAERLQAAVAYLRDKGHGKVAIVSHSMGARMANHFLADVHYKGGAVDAWVAVGISTGVYLHAENFKTPVLDIYGEKDFPAVLQNAAQRADAIKRVRGSGQISVAGADHYFNGAEPELVRHVKRFLDNVTR